MGRTPKPREQKEASGRSPGRDSGGRPLAEVVVELPSAPAVPDPPAELLTKPRARACSFIAADAGEVECDLCATDLAAEVWRELWTQGQTWLSLQRDRHVLLRLCKGYLEEAHLRRALEDDGHFVKGQRGGLVAHPAVTMLRVLEVQLTKLEGLCGFNPSDGGRLGIKVGKQRGTSALEQLLANRAATREQRAARRTAAQRPTRAKRTAESS